ncbi:amidohydrolase [Brachybacterium halotolerans subsp. kimchii]|uniref:amidohydrolase n=1 Tax=Brachybacterium halotolerans TaxID=2795215 RepID=UPI001E3EB6C7|nr:amidohydrolase [Brachybacterium halotolerans]UEJ84385.1 amidohydrolase [Brachybacterium halotolerans subsp. kimchii]
MSDVDPQSHGRIGEPGAADASVPGVPTESRVPTESPVPASGAHLEELDAAREQAMRTTSHPGSAFAGAGEELHTRLEEAVAADADAMVDLLLDLAAHPETAFEERRAAAAIAAVLEERALDPEVGVHGLETAIRAEISGAATAEWPTIAICAEYDALPGVGHGCGHNVIAAMGVGAFLALARLAATDPSAVPGRVVLLGTPAEEGHTGKEYMAREGAFDGLDAAVMAHPYPGYDLADQAWLGRRTLTVVFRGHTAHASAQPFMGRNALDAASLMYQGIGLMRQQTPPSDRIHAVIREGGERASVIPDTARLDLYVRSLAPSTLRDLSRRVEDVARGAALMTGCGVEISWDEHPPSLPVRTNEALTGRWVEAQRRRGRDPLPRGVVSETLAASTDFGNVSFRVPGMHPVIHVADADTALHTREFAAAATGDLARASAADGAYGLAATVLDMLHDAELAAAVREEFEAAGGAIDVPHYFD